MAKRAPIVIAATVVGATAVLLYKPMEPAGALASGATSSGAAATSSGSGSTDSASSSSTAGSSSSSSSAAPSSGSSSSGTSAKSAAKDGTYTGSAVQTRFGSAQIEVTIGAGRITAVTAVQLPADDPRSQSIGEQAEPYLKQEVLAKQGASVDVISGATYTSEGYMASLQSALDQAGYTAPDGSKASLTVPDEGGFHR